MRVLMVDDDPAIAEVIAEAFRAEHHDVDCASEREEAEALFHHIEYDVIITDLCLTGFGSEGLDLIKTIGVLQPRPFAVVMTGNSTPLCERAALDCGADLFVSKPVRARDLMHWIRTELAQKQQCANLNRTAGTTDEQIRAVHA